jgi:putative ABC transport system permease protein
MPYFNNLTGKQFSTASLRQFIPMTALIVLAILVSVVAGIYPALIVSGTQVISVVKKGFSFTGGSDQLRKILIVVQFSVSVFLIIYTTILLQQLKFMQTKDLGYNKEQVLVLPIGGQMLSDFDNLKKAWLQVPGIKSVTASYETPEYVQWGDGIVATDEKGKQSVSLKAMPVDIDFTQTMGMKIVAGRDFQESDFAIMDTLNNYANYHQPYVINEALAKKIGWKPEEAIGKIIDKGVSGPVVGVVKDFNFNSLHESIGPLLIFLNRDLSRNFLIRVNEKNLSATLANIGTVWKERIPERPFNYRFLDDDYNKLYLAEQRTASLFSVASGLAIVLACLGLFGLAAYTTLRRTKEIGIRRVMGANSGSLVLLLSKNFIQLVAMAVIIALPLAWWAGYMWLQNFAYRTGISWWIFIGAAVMALAITLITVGIQVLKAVLSNPVKNLRIE